jgi:hypothetical protein
LNATEPAAYATVLAVLCLVFIIMMLRVFKVSLGHWMKSSNAVLNITGSYLILYCLFILLLVLINWWRSTNAIPQVTPWEGFTFHWFGKLFVTKCGIALQTASRFFVISYPFPGLHIAADATAIKARDSSMQFPYPISHRASSSVFQFYFGTDFPFRGVWIGLR